MVSDIAALGTSGYVTLKEVILPFVLSVYYLEILGTAATEV